MRKTISYGLIIVTLVLAGCSEKSESGDSSIWRNQPEIMNQAETYSYDVTEQKSVSTDTDSSVISGGIDYFADYSSNIEAEVNAAVKASTSLQEEIENINRVEDKYSEWAKQAKTQTEMNLSSVWFYTIWDKELNSLWSRISDNADEQTKKKILSAQRNWISMKEEVVMAYLGPREDGGSIYPCLEQGLLKEMTFNRCNILANELAKIKGETFTMPERSVYGIFVDNQGTGDVYSSLITRLGWENDNKAVISIYRLITLEGSFIDNGNGELTFTSNEGDVKGIIRVNGWDGASFEVTESADTRVLTGRKYEFDFVF